MKAYIVGGAVRDSLLGLPSNDRDWVVVGATPEQMIGAGYTPVGRDFPVFLHPTTHEEYALARTERKAGRGYHGFTFHAAPEVTLEQDLARRDLTINAMALDPDNGQLIDPFDGQADLRSQVLRHVSSAFAEDPVRLLRLARFAARWPQYTVADETRTLLRHIVESGEIDSLVAERTWQELSRGLAETRPSAMFDLLRDCGALARLAPALDAWCGDAARCLPLMRVLDALPAAPAELRFACLCHGLDGAGRGTTPGLPLVRALCRRWRVDADRRELALMVAREWPLMREPEPFDAAVCMALLERCDAWRRAQRTERALQVFDALGGMLPDHEQAEVRRHNEQVRRALHAACAVRTASLPAEARDVQGPALGAAMRAARLQAIAQAFVGS
jgi:tRNA nucleotidyltransferase (CCA-adding enzyme)